jgi:hypothetical protein
MIVIFIFKTVQRESTPAHNLRKQFIPLFGSNPLEVPPRIREVLKGAKKNWQSVNNTR